MRRLARIAAAMALLAALTGMQLQPCWGPRGNGTLDHEDDLRWVMFHDAAISADDARRQYRARFSPAMSRMDDVAFDITGYILPVEPSTHTSHFVLTRRSTGCPFCPPDEPTETIEVFAEASVDFTRAPVTVAGILHLERAVLPDDERLSSVKGSVRASLQDLLLPKYLTGLDR